MNCIHIYTDGASKGNPGHAGIGIVMIYNHHRKEFYKYLGMTTNNIAELTAIKYALDQINNKTIPTIVYSDSQYAIGCLQNSKWNPKKNKVLIENIKQQIKLFKSIQFKYVKAHSGIKENERADWLANKAIETKGTSE